MRFSIINLGCKVNRVESDAIAALLEKCGAMPSDLGHANLVVVNTCAVTGEAEKKTRKAVRHALRESGQASILVTGCAAALHPEAFERMSPRVTCVAKAQLESAVSAFLPSVDETAPLPHGSRIVPLRMGGGFPTRVGVKVQDGCNNACTYCIVHVARGPAVSRPIGEIVRECVSYAHEGIMEIVLTGINLGSYCVTDRKGGAIKLAGLLRTLLDATSDFVDANGRPCRFRVSSVEPRDIDDDFIDVLASAEGRVCRHLHLPLQSGSSKVLREMARPYDALFFLNLVDRLRQRVPQLSLSTDIIVGFPGETDAEFNETVETARCCRFSKIHAFPYSVREGTPAARRSDQLPADVKASRCATVRSLGEALRTQDFARRIGTSELVVVEQDGRGMSESYYEVPVPPEAEVGSLIKCRLKERLA